MHMVGHDDPGMEPVPIAIEVEERLLNEAGMAWLAEPRATQTLIQIRLDPPEPFAGRIVLRQQRQLVTPLGKPFMGERVCQAKRHELSAVAVVEVREVVARIPSPAGSAGLRPIPPAGSAGLRPVPPPPLDLGNTPTRRRGEQRGVRAPGTVVIARCHSNLARL